MLQRKKTLLSLIIIIVIAITVPYLYFNIFLRFNVDPITSRAIFIDDVSCDPSGVSIEITSEGSQPILQEELSITDDKNESLEWEISKNQLNYKEKAIIKLSNCNSIVNNGETCSYRIDYIIRFVTTQVVC